ncbi:MAG: Preprotein translocase, SecE subunit [Microgenomates group bacterium GW2011_GWC1_41_8]|uniref:Protein translocase subunit SecE n=2 Tax=Candidatus Roizmaniibacteriota TaxID=1752723 RepID=A0A0G0XBN9_9BACT|nr:MAG: Preprotein translocase, SecE subunit [Candidatus Roizmanbacteria bacterium GW2011_GWB1_40_7]KKS21802.1 MAG: Preprotein translocase, SecE subunit [Candidatus Roizmanbacteria bacterium GW2011_GWC2_41_7]KKS23802.1 MAG: Preprotein translocase, SecE subunit [Microgenomates group bacterium GW2011_GWC1_41_8]
MDPVKFLKEVRRELQKVAWPTRAEVTRMTGLVIIVSLAVGIYIGLIDITLAKTLESVIK